MNERLNNIADNIETMPNLKNIVNNFNESQLDQDKLNMYKEMNLSDDFIADFMLLAEKYPIDFEKMLNGGLKFLS